MRRKSHPLRTQRVLVAHRRLQLRRPFCLLRLIEYVKQNKTTHTHKHALPYGRKGAFRGKEVARPVNVQEHL